MDSRTSLSIRLIRMQNFFSNMSTWASIDLHSAKSIHLSVSWPHVAFIERWEPHIFSEEVLFALLDLSCWSLLVHNTRAVHNTPPSLYHRLKLRPLFILLCIDTLPARLPSTECIGWLVEWSITQPTELNEIINVVAMDLNMHMKHSKYRILLLQQSSLHVLLFASSNIHISWFTSFKALSFLMIKWNISVLQNCFLLSQNSFTEHCLYHLTQQVFQENKLLL